MKYVVLIILIFLNLILASFAVGTTTEYDVLEKKVGTLLIAAANPDNAVKHVSMGVKTVHVFNRDSVDSYHDLIDSYRSIDPSVQVSVDLEGCRNPFPWHDSLDLHTLDESQWLPKMESDLAAMNQVGATINFAPVLDLGDSVWGCRSLGFEKDEVVRFGTQYVDFFQNRGIFVAVKHYPGATLFDDTHLEIASSIVREDDLFVFNEVIGASSPSMVMVNHLVSTGEVDSMGLPNSASPVIIANLKSSYSGIVVSDEIGMLGLMDRYDSVEEAYLSVMIAGVDMVPYFSEDPADLDLFIKTVASAVRSGLIPESQIDESYRKVLALQDK